MSVTQYIGARYVPMFAEPIDWDITKSYSPLTIVYHQGNSYTSKQSVPSGTDINNETYWALTGNYNAQIEQYRAEVVSAKTEADTATTVNTSQDAQLAGTTASGLKSLISAEGNKNDEQDNQLDGTVDSGLKTLITDETTARTTKDTSLDKQLAGTTDSGLKTLIYNESSVRSTKDIAIDSQLAGKTTSGLKTLLDSQLSGTSDSGLKTLISTETIARTTKDTSLDRQLAGTTDSGLKTLITNETNRATQAELGLNEKNVITIGDSYFCDEPGLRKSIVTELKTIATKWNIVNYADSGSAFTFGGAIGYTFLQQLKNAAAAQTAANVDIVIIAGGRNEAGAQDSGAMPAANLSTAINACLSYAKSTFINAKIYMFPLIYDWKIPNPNCYNVLTQIENCCVNNNIWCAKGCYTWGSGEESTKYVGGTDIHPNTQGALFMANAIMTAIINNNPITYVNRCAIVNDSLWVYMIDGNLLMRGGLASNGSGVKLAEITDLPTWLHPTGSYTETPIPAYNKITGDTRIIILYSGGIDAPGATPGANQIFMISSLTKYVN